MDDNLRNKLGGFAAKLITSACESGLKWDEAVAAFGLASRGLVLSASAYGDGTVDDCIVHAQKRFNEGIGQAVTVNR